MTVIVIKPRNKSERDFLNRLLRKMNIDALFIEEPEPNKETRNAINDVELLKGTRVKNSQELFSKLGI